MQISKVLSGIILVLILAPFHSNSQLKGDTTFIKSSYDNAKNEYNKTFLNQLQIYNGRDYKLYNPKKEEHPYFETNDWVEGTLIYEKDPYENVPMLYDLSSDKLIIENRNGIAIELASDKIQSFKINNHVFINLNNIIQKDISAGFYELLYDGKIKLYAKRKKNYREHISGTVLEAEFEIKSKYYLLVENKFYVVSNKSSVIKALEQSRELPKPPKSNQPINPNNKTESRLVFLVSYYDSVNEAL